MHVLLIVYDNESYIHWFPLGIAYIASVVRNCGCKVTVYNQDIHHFSESQLTKYLDENDFDVVGVGIVAGYYQYRKLLKISEAINRSKRRPFFVLGGHGPSPEPEFFLRNTKADLVVIGEAEDTILEVIQVIEKKRDFNSVKGIAFWSEGKIIINDRRAPIDNLDSISMPAYDLFPTEYYRLLRLPHVNNCDFIMPIISGRGCPFKCTFCYRLEEGFRQRSNESIIEEIKLLTKDFGITYIAFCDELLMSSEDRTQSFCEELLISGLKVKWDCNGRLNYATPRLLKLMKKAGCVFINYGIEAMDDNVLKNMRKALNTKQIIKGIEATLNAGISPGLNILFGNIGDSKDTLKKGVDFLLKYDDGAQMRTIRPVTPYPGSPLYYYAIEKGLLKDCDDFYNNKHLNSDLISINFTEMSDDEFHKALFEANSELLTHYFKKKCDSHIYQAERLYLYKDSAFRGFRQS